MNDVANIPGLKASERRAAAKIVASLLHHERDRRHANETAKLFGAFAAFAVEAGVFPEGEGHRAFWGAWSMWCGWTETADADVQEGSWRVGRAARIMYDALRATRGLLGG